MQSYLLMSSNADDILERLRSTSTSHTFVSLLKRTARTSSRLTDAEKTEICREIDFFFEVSIDQRVLSDVVWSLGKLSIELRTLKTNSRRSLMQAIVVATASDNQDDGRNDGMAVGRLVYGLSQMGARWQGSTSLSDTAKRGLLDALAWHWDRGQMSEQTLVNTVYALGKMECPYLSLPANTRRLLLTELQRTSSVMGPAAVANVLWALGRMKAKWSLLSDHFRRSMLARIVEASPLGSHALTIAVTGLAKMGTRWSDMDLDPATRTAMLEAAVQLCHGATEQQLSNLVHGLAKMGATWMTASSYQDSDDRDQLPKELRMRLIVTVEALAPKFTDLGLTNTVYGLAKMGCELKDPSLPGSALTALSTALFGPVKGSGAKQSSRLSRMSDQSVSLLVWSFGQGGVKWTNEHADAVATGSESLPLIQQPSRVLAGPRECMEMAGDCKL